MNMAAAALEAAKVLAHPVILWGAWLRVNSWYKYGELAPQPELSYWRLHPEARLRELAEALRRDQWSPDRWQQVPYPKKGGRLRHYVVPSIRDQVALMAHMVALGPILDCQIANFAFGNRWYRPIAWDRRESPAHWVHRPYPILTDRIHLSYARSHGLYRRVAHWTVARMTNAPLPAEDSSGQPQLPEDYGPETLPKWTEQAWWTGTAGSSRALWAALDIELAYPSVRIEKLTIAMEHALRQPVDVFRLFDGCPRVILEALEDEAVRVDIGHRLTRALGEITLDTNGIPLDSWAPPQGHRLPKVTAEPYEGIPTGLAISGMLLNVVLLEADRVIGSYLNRTSGKRRGAIVRFVDDMYLLSRSSAGLFSLVEAVHGALSGFGAASLAMPNEASNICISFKKIKPDAAQKVVEKYLLANDWTPCKECDQPLPPSPQVRPAQGISEWWENVSEVDAFSTDREALERAAIKQGDVGPFVTTLVERLSDMGTDTLRHRFGEGARDHVARLHELARFDIEDEQVKPDTRRTFSVNRLVRAWLPRAVETGEEHKQLRRIRETVSFVLDRTPWKFAIWRAVARAAARRPFGTPANEQDDAQEAKEWLSNQLRRIACVSSSGDSGVWLNVWPENNLDDDHSADRTEDWRALYLSFLRAAFWRSLAEVVRELGRHAARQANEDADTWMAPPTLWSTRAVPDSSHADVAASLASVDEWVEVLYPVVDGIDLAEWPWELDEFVAAILAVHTTKELTDGWRSTIGPGSVLRVPASARLNEMPKAARLLSRFGRLQETGPRRNRKLDFWALANVRLGCWDRELGNVLFPAPDRSRIRRAATDPRGVVAAGFTLGLPVPHI